MDYPGWTVETSHPVDEADPLYCATCAGMIPGTVQFAIDWGSTGHNNQHTDTEGVTHTVTVRQV